MRASALAGNGKASYEPRGDVTQSQYHFLFPSTTLNIAPGIPNISLERYLPDGLRRTVEVTDYYFGAEEIDELMTWDNQIAEEDVSLVQSVQRGLDSGVVPQGRLMGESESSSPTSSAGCTTPCCVETSSEVVDEAVARFFQGLLYAARPR